MNKNPITLLDVLKTYSNLENEELVFVMNTFAHKKSNPFPLTDDDWSASLTKSFRQAPDVNLANILFCQINAYLADCQKENPVDFQKLEMHKLYVK